ncbi:uncharacterized protein [Asterias amurensis]|uniref:uncharacterized protein n=1 Tax=Asterias amurensis TaxID=7602 RepID=UPI003AB27DE3
MTEFVVKDTIVINTQSCGECYIDLCLGDITRLDKKDKVDVICVSVFGCSYQPTPHTLIGSLHTNLGLSIKQLSENKAEDLRHAYMCWISQPLPDHLPYRKLLCFENSGRRVRPHEMVGNVFRCLVPVLKNEPGTVISPLLNTGAQGLDEARMLGGIVDAAVKWMKAGLPLKRLKIVLYASVVKGKVISIKMRDPDGILKTFENLKKRYNKLELIPMVVPLEYDIYLSHSPEDAETASLVEAKFRSFKPNIRIYKCTQVLDESSWQEDMFKIMSRCARVVPILSPAFLENSDCIDLFNLALCVNRRAQRDLLAPIYIEEVKDMPTYMGLVQYINCSPKDEKKISDGCQHLVQSLEHASMKVHTEMVMADTSPIHYDVFVSYSHRDSRLANPIVEKLQKLNPKLRIFFDVQELKAGTAWQRMLYHAIDGCRSFVALVSNSYMKSAMCIEEFNLALAKHCSTVCNLRHIPVCIEPLVDPLPEFTQIKMINATPGVYDRAVEIICSSLVSWIGGGTINLQMETILSKKKSVVVDASDYAVECRRLKFIQKCGDPEDILRKDDHKIVVPPSIKGLFRAEAVTKPPSADAPCDIAFSYAPEDKKYVMFMSKVLQLASPGLVIKASADTETERLALMESARKVVVFLSAYYMESVEQIEELHTVLLRQRYQSHTPVLFPIIIHNLPQLPTYFHLIPCDFNLCDPIWINLYAKYRVNIPWEYEDVLRKMSKSSKERCIETSSSIGIITAIHSLLEQLKYERQTPKPPRLRDQPMLLNVMLLRSELTRLNKEVNLPENEVDTKEGQQDSIHCSDENYLLNIVKESPKGTKAPLANAAEL